MENYCSEFLLNKEYSARFASGRTLCEASPSRVEELKEFEEDLSVLFFPEKASDRYMVVVKIKKVILTCIYNYAIFRKRSVLKILMVIGNAKEIRGKKNL